MPRGPGRLIKMHIKPAGYKCMCCENPLNPNIIDDGT